ncbi:MAG: aldehyde dehydrogenase family protein [Limisphaerales bacterium]
MTGRLLIGGRWIDGRGDDAVTNKYSGAVIGRVAVADEAQVREAIGAAAKAAAVMARLPAHRRAEILRRTAEGLVARREELARLIAQEAGKALKFARVEVGRAIDTFVLAGEEARRIHGETVPLDAVAAGEGYFGFWHRKPVGVVVAITPFNFPLNLVAHKVAPALAAGNPIVLKPAQLTPLTAVVLCELLLEAGLPEGAINLITGSGGRLGPALVSDPRVAKVSFTGSAPVGQSILAHAGIKRVTLELGNAAPVVIAGDADLDWAAKRCAIGAFYNSGQVCISTQRIYAVDTVYAEFEERLLAATASLKVGDPLDEATDVGPMIQEAEAQRIEGWVNEAAGAGARILTGHRREGPVYWPTVMSDTRPTMKIVEEEAFGPVVTLSKATHFSDALEQADATRYGLQAAVFTRDIDAILTASERLNFGGLIVNDVPSFRADNMPYGGNRQSGIGREGVRFAMEEMTAIQMVAIRRRG